MNSNRWLLIGALVALLLLGSCLERTTSFNNLKEAQISLRSLGYYCISDRRDGIIGNGFLVSCENVDWVEVNSMAKVGQIGEEWRGRIWFAVIDDAEAELLSVPDWPGRRVWGNVVAFGDDQLLDEIDARLTRDRFRIRIFNSSH